MSIKVFIPSLLYFKFVSTPLTAIISDKNMFAKAYSDQSKVLGREKKNHITKNKLVNSNLYT